MVAKHNATLVDQMRTGKTKIERSNKHNDELNDRVKAQSARIAELESTTRSQTVNNDNTTARAAATAKRLEWIEGEVKARDEQISSLRTTETELNFKIKTMTTCELTIREAKNALAKYNDELKSDITAIRGDLEKCKVANTKLGEALITKATEYDMETKNLQRRTAELESVDQVNLKQIQDLESKIVENGRTLDKQRAELRESTTLSDERAKEIEVKNAALARLEQRLETQRTDLEVELGESQDQTKQLRIEAKASAGRLAVFENEAGKLRKAIDGMIESAKERTTKINSLQAEMADLVTQQDAAVQKAQSNGERPADIGIKESPQPDVAEVSGVLALPGSDALTRGNLCVLHEAYQDFPDHRYQLHFDGWILPRRTGRKQWIGSDQAEKMLGVACEEKHVAFDSLYGRIPNRRMSIVVDGRVVPRGIQQLPLGVPEHHTLEEAGVSITESDIQHSTQGNIYMKLTVRAVSDSRDRALEKEVELDHGPEAKRITNPQLTPPPDPSLRDRPSVGGPAPVAVMVSSRSKPELISDDIETLSHTAPNMPPEASLRHHVQSTNNDPRRAARDSLRHISSEVIAANVEPTQTAAPMRVDPASPRDSGQVTPQTPVQKPSPISFSVKRKATTQAVGSPAKQPKGPIELMNHHVKRSESVETRQKQRRSEVVVDPLERAPREPRRFRESGEAFRDGFRHHDTYDGRSDGRDDGREYGRDGDRYDERIDERERDIKGGEMREVFGKMT